MAQKAKAALGFLPGFSGMRRRGGTGTSPLLCDVWQHQKSSGVSGEGRGGLRPWKGSGYCINGGQLFAAAPKSFWPVTNGSAGETQRD